MPLGDSLSICCHRCGVPATSVTARGHTEPIAAWDGYIRKLWFLLDAARRPPPPSAVMAASIRSPHATSPSRFDFEFVGRVTTCMINSSKNTRVDTDGWQVCYEGYYGYSTGRIVSEVLHGALAAADPDVVVVILGTNDLIQAKAGGGGGAGGSRVQRALQHLKTIVHRILCLDDPVALPGASAAAAAACSRRRASRHVVLAMIPPILFAAIRAAPPSTRKPHRLRQLNDAIRHFVADFNELEDASDGRAPGQAHSGSDPDHRLSSSHPQHRLHLVDLFSNFSTTADLHGDGLHPNDTGEQKMAARIADVILHRVLQPVPVTAAAAAATAGGLPKRHLPLLLPLQRLLSNRSGGLTEGGNKQLVPIFHDLMMGAEGDGGGPSHPAGGGGGLMGVDPIVDPTLLLCVVVTLGVWLAAVVRRRSHAGLGRSKR